MQTPQARRSPLRLVLPRYAVAVSLLLVHCAGSADSQGGGTGGSNPSGSGGAAGNDENGSGGAQGTGGSNDTGGSGGHAGTGGAAGAQETGGSTGTGGSATSNGPVLVLAAGYGSTIASFQFDAQSGTLTPAKQLSGVEQPSFLAWHAPSDHFYAVNETDVGAVQAFSIARDGTISSINSAPSGGSGPGALSIDQSGHWVFVANYVGGSASILPIETNGGVGNPIATQDFGVNTEAHHAVFDATNKFAFVCLKGDDSVRQFKFDAASGQLAANSPASVKTAQGAGPRHMALHPDSKFAYVINEQGSTIVAYSFDATNGTLTEMQTEPTTEGGVAGSTAEIEVHPTGQWLYGSNRNGNDIVGFALGDDGRMTLMGHTDSGGVSPRHFSIAPGGKFMFVANEKSDNVVVFDIGDDGKLTRKGDPIVIDGLRPTFVGAITLP